MTDAAASPAARAAPSAVSALLDRAPWLLLPVAPLLWSGNVVVFRALEGDFPPATLAFLRWVLAFLILLPFAGRDMWRSRALIARHWLVICGCGAFGIAGYNALSYTALETLSSASFAVINSSLPLAVVFMAAVLRVESMRARILVSLLISGLGVTFILNQGRIGLPDASVVTEGGALYAFAAIINYAIFSVILRWRPKGLSTLTWLTVTLPPGFAIIAPFFLMELAAGQTMPLTWDGFLALGYITIFPSIIAYAAWSESVARIGPSVTGLSIHMVPIFAPTLAWVALSESVAWYHPIGFVLILSGVLIATLKRKTPAAPAADPAPTTG